MGVVVMVVINRQALCVLPKQLNKGRIAADLLRVARAADMAVEAHHLIGCAHHQMQVVRNHQYAAAVAVAQAGDQGVQL